MSQEVDSEDTPAGPPENESYACFLRHKNQIETWLRSGYSIKGVWAACKHATPPFRGSYQTFWRYCRDHRLRQPRATTATASLRSPVEPKPAPEAPPALATPPQIWPRLSGKPREFVPRTED